MASKRKRDQEKDNDDVNKKPKSNFNIWKGRKWYWNMQDMFTNAESDTFFVRREYKNENYDWQFKKFSEDSCKEPILEYKNFTSFENRDAFIKFLYDKDKYEILPSERSFHEIILEDQPTHGVYDLEWVSYFSETNDINDEFVKDLRLKENERLSKFLNHLQDATRQQFDNKELKLDLAINTASRFLERKLQKMGNQGFKTVKYGWKSSFHVYVLNVGYQNFKLIENSINNYLSPLIEKDSDMKYVDERGHEKYIIDLQIYRNNGSLRIHGCIKVDDEHSKLTSYADDDITTKPIESYYIGLEDSKIEYYVEASQVKETTNNFVQENIKKIDYYDVINDDLNLTEEQQRTLITQVNHFLQLKNEGSIVEKIVDSSTIRCRRVSKERHCFLSKDQIHHQNNCYLKCNLNKALENPTPLYYKCFSSECKYKKGEILGYLGPLTTLDHVSGFDRDYFTWNEFVKKYTLPFQTKYEVVEKIKKDLNRVMALIRDGGSGDFVIKSSIDKLYNLSKHVDKRFVIKYYEEKKNGQKELKKVEWPKFVDENAQDLFKSYEGIMCNPLQEGKDKNKFNLWEGIGTRLIPKEEVKIELIAPILLHMKNVLANDDETSYIFILSFFAYMFKQPWKKYGVAPIFVGTQGIGKSLFMAFIRMILGSRVAKELQGLAALTKNYNEDLCGQVYINLDEMQNDKYLRGNWDAFKYLITQETLQIIQKYVNSYTVDNFIHFTGTSNNPRCINTDKDNRRFAIFECSRKYKNKERLAMLWELIKRQDVQEAFYSYLYHMDESELVLPDEYHIPKTKILEATIRRNRPTVELFLDEVRSGEYNLRRECFPADEEDEKKFEMTAAADKKFLEKVSENILYQKYKKYCESQNINIMKKLNFVEEVANYFRDAENFRSATKHYNLTVKIN